MKMIRKYSELQDPRSNSNFKTWFRDSKVVDSSGKPLPVYHGTARPDRVKDFFNPNRATSGPMAFFTDDPEVASGYAQGKPDTSLEHPEGFAGWFKYKVGRTEVPIDQAWFYLSSEEKKTVAERIYTVGYKDPEEGQGPIVPNSTSLMNKNGITEYLQRKRGNALAALVEIWLSSGSLYDEEEVFLDVLKAAGLDINKVRYDSPYASYPSVYAVYLSIQNPLDTSAIPQEVMQALKEAGKRKRPKIPAGGNPDSWDKNTISGPDWLRNLEEDIKNKTTYAWVRIPDWATETLKKLGYDGIKDTGGKHHSHQHTVWVPFYPHQVKSVFNPGKFDPTKKKILSSEESYKFVYWKNCVDFEEGSEVQDLVQQDEYEYPEETFFHPPHLRISREEFQRLTGKKFSGSKLYFSKTSYPNVIFYYDPKKDIHYFYLREKRY